MGSQRQYENRLVKTVGVGVGGPCHIYAYEGIVPAEMFILQYIFPCPPLSINNDLSQEPCLSLIFHSFFLIGLFKIAIAMVVFSVVLLLLIGQFCQGIIIYIKFIVTKNFNSHNPYSGSKFLFVFSCFHFRSMHPGLLESCLILASIPIKRS